MHAQRVCVCDGIHYFIVEYGNYPLTLTSALSSRRRLRDSPFTRNTLMTVFASGPGARGTPGSSGRG